MFSPTVRSSTPSHPGTATRRSTTPPCGLNRSGTPNSTLVRGGRSGPTRPNGHGETRRPWPPRRPGHGRSSTASKKAKSARFVKVRGDDRRIDEASLARAQSLVGLKGYVTNRAHRGDAGRRSHREVPRPVARREVVSHVQERPSWPADVPLHPRRDRGAPDASCSPPWPSPMPSRSRTGLSISKVVKQLRPLRSATININGATQTFPPAIPAGSPKNPDRPRSQTRVLSKMSEVRPKRLP